MIENMSAPNQKGRIDPASLLDDYTTPNPFLYNRLAQPKVVADVTTSAEAQPLKRQVQPFVGGYSSYPAPRGKQTTLDNANTGHIQLACDDKHHATHVTPLNMHLQNNIVSQRMMVKECVKTVLFRRLKFYKKDLYGLYDLRNGTVCAMIIANCNVNTRDATQAWWADMRKLVVSTHTDRRNNVIKNMHLRFKGMYPVTLQNVIKLNAYTHACVLRWYAW
jgi:hypothetical protein